mmetsp:Transcript_5513/g.14964  ORF Transcript_5513/g.14964 Transcript_5513/m.14964 type:complete len:142 (+) Transcript_5513:106-531(+)
MSFVARSTSLLARRMAVTTTRRNVRTVPRLGTPEEMRAEAAAQIRARVAYQKELAAANPHKSIAEEWKELWTWIKISILVCGPICTFAMTKDMLTMEHEHRPHGALPEYMGIRNKEFPWECDQCDLFDGECWKKCRAEKAA